VDPRSLRTRRALQQAALDLAIERALDEITIGDIAERAGVNRSSFYQHYSDKETLLADALDAIVEAAGASIEVAIEPTEEPPAGLVGYLEHVDAHAGGASPFEGIPEDVVAAGVAGSALGVVRVWLDTQPRADVGTAAEWIWRMLLRPGRA